VSEQAEGGDLWIEKTMYIGNGGEKVDEDRNHVLLAVSATARGKHVSSHNPAAASRATSLFHGAHNRFACRGCAPRVQVQSAAMHDARMCAAQAQGPKRPHVVFVVLVRPFKAHKLGDENEGGTKKANETNPITSNNCRVLQDFAVGAAHAIGVGEQRAAHCVVHLLRSTMGRI